MTELDPAIVEAAAKATYTANAYSYSPPWEVLEDGVREMVREQVRIALSAAAPLIAAKIKAERDAYYAEPNGLNPHEDGEYVGLTRAIYIAGGTVKADPLEAWARGREAGYADAVHDAQSVVGQDTPNPYGLEQS